MQNDAIVFENSFNKPLEELTQQELSKLKEQIRRVLQQSSITNQLRIFKNCY
jgi:hypothetical protein